MNRSDIKPGVKYKILSLAKNDAYDLKDLQKRILIGSDGEFECGVWPLDGFEAEEIKEVERKPELFISGPYDGRISVMESMEKEKEETYKCTTCDGSGEIEDNGPKACNSCGGNGFHWIEASAMKSDAFLSSLDEAIAALDKAKEEYDYSELNGLPMNFGVVDEGLKIKGENTLIPNESEFLEKEKEQRIEKFPALEDNTTTVKEKAFSEGIQYVVTAVKGYGANNMGGDFFGLLGLLERLEKEKEEIAKKEYERLS